MITELTVQNFKGIDSVTLEDMRQFVLIVGRNGVGKSSLLEAVSLLMGGEVLDESVARWNGLQVLISATRADGRRSCITFGGDTDSCRTEQCRRDGELTQLIPACRNKLCLSELPDKRRLLEVLRMVDSTIDEVTVVGMKTYLRSGGKLIPLECASSSLRNMATLFMHAVIVGPGGVLLVDEIENGFHYELYGEMWNTLANVVKERNAQLIATTQSYEFLESAAESVGASHDAELLSVYRMDRSRRRQAVRYGAKELEAALQYGMEVR